MGAGVAHIPASTSPAIDMGSNALLELRPVTRVAAVRVGFGACRGGGGGCAPGAKGRPRR